MGILNMRTPTIVILNGLPSCGKDTLGNYMQSCSTFFRKEFKEPLIKATMGLYDLEWEAVNRISTRENKELPQPELGGISWRDALIHTSEEVVKPMFGKDIFGRRMVKRLKEDYDRIFGGCDFIFSDGGFVEEIQALVDEFGADSLMVLRIHGYGDTSVKDSRKFLQEEDFPEVAFFDYNNTGTLTDFLEDCKKEILKFKLTAEQKRLK